MGHSNEAKLVSGADPRRGAFELTKRIFGLECNLTRMIFHLYFPYESPPFNAFMLRHIDIGGGLKGVAISMDVNSVCV
jgi:hypothetical protein